MAFQALITDLSGVVRDFIGDYESMRFTRRLGGFSEFKLVLDPRDDAVDEILIAERCMKVYDGANLRFFGQIWEPLEFTAASVNVPARDPFAGLEWRRVRAGVTYTSEDAGAIANARLAIQNGYRDTFLSPEEGSVSISDRAGTLTDGSAVITGLSTTADLITGMFVTGLGFGTAVLVSIDNSTQITINKLVDLDLPARTATVTGGSKILTGIASTADLYAGMGVSRPGDIAAGSKIASVDSSTQVTMDVAAVGSGTDQVVFSHTPAQLLDFSFSSSASADRTITYDAGKREDEIVKELSAMSEGFFFRVDPLDGVPGKMGTLRILYPDAGTTRAEVRFGFGNNSVDNLVDFRIVRMLPVTRMTAASQSDTGGRIAASAEVAAATTEFGLFEDEIAYTDLPTTALLQVQADAGTKPTPPLTIELTPNSNAPLLFTDFDVGDFVKLNIEHGHVIVEEWVRVIEAVMEVDKQGLATLISVTIETLSGSRVSQDPARLFRAQLDANRARLEALERRVQEITTTPAAAPAPPTSTGGSDGSSTTPVDTEPPPPPPPPPSRVPGVAMSQAYGFNDSRGKGAHLTGAVTPFDSTTSVTFIIRSGSSSGSVVKITPARTYPGSNNLVGVIEDTTGLSAGVTYWAAINAANAAGQATSGYLQFTVPSIAAE